MRDGGALARDSSPPPARRRGGCPPPAPPRTALSSSALAAADAVALGGCRLQRRAPPRAPSRACAPRAPRRLARRPTPVDGFLPRPRGFLECLFSAAAGFSSSFSPPVASGRARARLPPSRCSARLPSRRRCVTAAPSPRRRLRLLLPSLPGASPGVRRRKSASSLRHQPHGRRLVRAAGRRLVVLRLPLRLAAAPSAGPRAGGHHLLHPVQRFVALLLRLLSRCWNSTSSAARLRPGAASRVHLAPRRRPS